MQQVLIVVHLIVVLALIGVVLLQRSEGGLGLGGGGGVSGFMTGRGQASALTRATAILAALFFVSSMTLSILATHNRAPRSILDTGAAPVSVPAGPAAPAQDGTAQGQGGGTLLDQLGGDSSQPTTPSAPSGPQAPQPQ